MYINSYIGLDREHVLKAEASYKLERDGRCADFLAKKRSLSEEMSTLQVCIACANDFTAVQHVIVL